MPLWIWLVLSVAFAIFVQTMAPDPPYDNTDPPGGRSNLELHTDCLTGLQYLSSLRGGLTPRLDREGNQIMDKAGC